MMDFICETFFNYSELVGSFVGLLCLAPDHLHLYVESDGEKSAETIAQQMKLLSVAPILSEFAELMAISNVEKNLWDKAYFVETVG
jgi:REP element-mobilizing transposase RayT